MLCESILDEEQVINSQAKYVKIKNAKMDKVKSERKYKEK